MKDKALVGRKVRVYQDPYSMFDLEGIATIIKIQFSIGSGFRRAIVQFDGDPIFRYRKIHVGQVIEEQRS